MCSPPSWAKELLISILILTGLNLVLAHTNRMVSGLLHLPICLSVTPKNAMVKKKEVGKHMRKIIRIFQKVIKEQLSTVIFLKKTHSEVGLRCAVCGTFWCLIGKCPRGRDEHRAGEKGWWCPTAEFPPCHHPLSLLLLSICKL